MFKDKALNLVSFFPGKDIEINPVVVDHPETNWFFYAVVALLALLAWSRNFSPYRFFFILGAIFSYRKTEMLQSEGKVIRNGTSFAFVLISIFSVGLFAYQFKDIFYYSLLGNQGSPLLNIVYLSLAAGIIWLAKAVLAHFVGTLFKAPYSSSLFVSNIFITNTLAGLSVLIFTILYFYTKEMFFLYTPLYILFILYIYRLIRNFLIGRKAGKFSISYIILYICTLEILPVLVLYKFLKDHILEGI
ncbi:MAG: DUF4271 domain-containing protein [Bacteroidales bacterium]|nr:DUF4271 domain-containing protein [Bacteroidales bacterium]MCF8334440.1 DUF4271 domain-containing protein [Bacteroidales bacterium]